MPRVYPEGSAPVHLDRADFVAAGGEGAVYARDGVAYKLYDDPSTVDPARLRAISALRVPRSVLPDRLLRDEADQVVGFTMPHLADAVPFPRLCTRSFRESVGVDAGRALILAEGLRESVRAAHRSGALVVDLNPLNLLVTQALDAVWLIDTASWQLPAFPATAQLDLVRDRHAPPGVFSPGTDWFAYAIVVFQLLIGIHPYRGSHPTLKGLDARMQANASALRPDVSLPPACYPLDVLPDALRDWLHAVLEEGHRGAPPALSGAPTWLPDPASHAALTVVSLGRFGAPVRHYVEGAVPVAVTEGHVVVEGERIPLSGVEAVALTPRGTPVLASRDGGLLRLVACRTPTDIQPVATTLQADALMATRGRLYVRAGDQLVEVVLHEGRQVLASPRTVAQVLPHATRLYPGVAVQDVLGALHVHLPAPGGRCHTVRLDDLDGQRIIDARCDGTVLALLVAHADGLDRWIYRFDPAFQTRDLHVERGVTAGLDLVVLDTGVAVRRGELGLELFLAAPASHGVRAVEAPAGPLVSLGAQLGQIRGDEVVRLALRAS